MSIFSDYKVGVISDFEFRQECMRMNREDRWDREHMYDDLEIDLDSEDGDEDGEEQERRD